MPSFVNLESGSRTYIASLRVHPDFAAAGVTTAATRADRKQLAYGVELDAEAASRATLEPKLEALRVDGLVRSWEFAPGTGAVILNVAESRAGAAYAALRSVGELGRIERNRAVELTDGVGHETAPAPSAAAGLNVEWGVAKLGAPQVWATGTTGAGVVIGIIDTGANAGHELLAGHYRGANADGTQTNDYNFFDAVNHRAAIYDDNDHGSHCAGIVVGGSASDASGIAPGATFISAKVLDSEGHGSSASILKGLSWMLAPTRSDGSRPDPTKAPDIVSNSWGNQHPTDSTYENAWKAFEAAGIVTVVAAGNEGPDASTLDSPGTYPSGITVAATNQADGVADFSSRGPGPFKDAAGKVVPKPDVAAPGVRIRSAGHEGSGYVWMNGTSMATPAVAGLVALLLSRYPSLTTEQVRTALTSSAVDIDAPGWDVSSGAGRVDAVAAMAKAAQLAR